MRMENLGTKYLKSRCGIWYYDRRVPIEFSRLESRSRITISLKTDSLEIAKIRRDGHAEADDAFWREQAMLALTARPGDEICFEAAEQRYRSAVAYAMAQGFVYKPIAQIATGPLDEIVARLKAADAYVEPSERKTEALLGNAPDPGKAVTVSKAFDIFFKKIAIDDVYGKSEAQAYSWRKTKKASMQYFIDVIGDLPLSEITREKAIEYRDWWVAKMRPKDPEEKPVKPNTVNRHLGNMKSLWQRYHEFVGQPEIDNPFKGFFFKSTSKTKRLPFKDDWVQTNILTPSLFDDIHPELRAAIYLSIETGARLSEIVSLEKDDICLAGSVPHIFIRAKEQRELKTCDSERKIPLVGVAGIAAHTVADGFQHYFDKSTLASNMINKIFKERGLFPSDQHVFYSFRHAFEDRMKMARLDFELRCKLMGHKNNRPEYGTGGSLEFVRDELLKIAHPFPEEIFA